MNLWRVLRRFGGGRLLLSAGIGLLAGLAFAALMRLVHRALTLPAAELGPAALEFAALVAAYFLGSAFSEHALNDAAERLQSELRRDILRQLLATPLRRLERLGVTRLFDLLGGQVKIVADYVCWLPNVAINFAIVLGCFAYMARLSPAVLAFNLGFVALAAACYVAPLRVAQRVGRAARRAWDRHVWQMHYSVLAARNLLLSGAKRADFASRHFAPTADEVRALNRRHRLINLFTERFAEAMVLGNVACLLFLLPDSFGLTAETRTGLLLAAVFVRAPLKSLLDVFPRTQGAALALERMREADLEIFTPVPAAPPAFVRPAGFRELRLRGVAFRYESDHDQAGFSAGPFDLEVRAGEIVFIVGGNGSGKTTLAKLLCGLYAPDSGTLEVDGAAVATEADRAALRERFAAVFSEDHLFEDLLGTAPGAAAARGADELRRLRLDLKVSLAGTALSTVDLSQGQRRRLLLLGALLENRPILLLDEWAADQDPEFRRYFYEELLPDFRARGMTVVLISHDDRYFHRADRLVKLDAGRLAPAARA